MACTWTGNRILISYAISTLGMRGFGMSTTAIHLPIFLPKVSGKARQIAPSPPGKIEKLTFRFDEEVELGGSSLIVTFDNSCGISS